MSDMALTVLIVVFFPLAFGMMWTTILWALALCGGWRALANAYAHPRPIPETSRRAVSGMLGWVGYNHVLITTYDARYLYLDVWMFFRPGHPALRIPLTALRKDPRKAFFFKRLVRLQVGSPVIASLALPADVLPDGLA